jgi:peptidoglycan/xylan/chitin deacetylase (PgdA/CDA1 family)
MKRIALLYHDVVERDEFLSSGFTASDANIYKLDCATFENHLDAVICSNPSVSFTFDDGGVSFYDSIAPALERRGRSGHFFIATNWIGRPGFVTAPQILELRQRGHEIGTHSCSHPERMSHCAFEAIVEEWRRSSEILSEILGERIESGSVPGGYFSKKVAKAAAQAGLRTLFTSEPTTHTHLVDGCSIVGRFTIQRGVTPETAAALARGDFRTCLQQSAYWNSKKVLKVAGGTAWLKLRKRLLEKTAA